MNFNVYVNRGMGEKITKVAKKMHRSRNSIVTEALEEWIDAHTPAQWPKNFFDFSPIKNVPDFKELRNELKDIPEDPLS